MQAQLERQNKISLQILYPIQMETISNISILYPIVSKLFAKYGNGFQKNKILFQKDENIWKHFMKERVYPKWINVRVLTGGLCCGTSFTYAQTSDYALPVLFVC